MNYPCGTNGRSSATTTSSRKKLSTNRYKSPHVSTNYLKKAIVKATGAPFNYNISQQVKDIMENIMWMLIRRIVENSCKAAELKKVVTLQLHQVQPMTQMVLGNLKACEEARLATNRYQFQKKSTVNDAANVTEKKKRVTRSVKAGTTFPVARISEGIRKYLTNNIKNLSDDVAVYITRAVEFVSVEIMIATVLYIDYIRKPTKSVKTINQSHLMGILELRYPDILRHYSMANLPASTPTQNQFLTKKFYGKGTTWVVSGKQQQQFSTSSSNSQ